MSSSPAISARSLALFVIFVALTVAVPAFAQDTGAQCNLTFDAVWSSETHPIEFPASAHFSGLVGGTHHDGVSFWQPGGFATPGIRSMAETGSKTLLLGEVQDAVDNGTADAAISGGSIPLSPGVVDVDFPVTLEFPLATVVSMIAPSPDWFVGIHGLSLFEQGRWNETTVVQLPPYDAGTDSGTTFTSPDNPTTPAETITMIAQDPFPNSTSLGTFTITCVSDLLYYNGFESGDLSTWDGAAGADPLTLDRDG